LNLRPHPYQLNAGNRCADRRFRSSRPTVGARVMRSIGAMVRVLDILEVVRSLSRAPGPLGRHARLPGRGAPEPGARTPPLPCPGCRLPDQIASLQQRRNRLALNWCGFLIAETRERPEQLGTQPKAAEVVVSSVGSGVIVGLLLLDRYTHRTHRSSNSTSTRCSNRDLTELGRL
jgi:hypothetical protein